MTEEEAKTKWCPMFRGNDHGVNRPDQLQTDARLGFCVGSACMAWRWDRQALTARMRNGDGSEYLVHPSKVRESSGTFVQVEPGQGYCGLAGKP